MCDASPLVTAPSGARCIRAALERIRSAERASEQSERERRRGQRDATRALVRVLQLDSADGERLARHADEARRRTQIAALDEQLRECERRFQEDKKRLASVQDKRARHEEVLRAKAARDQQVAPLRAALQELRLQDGGETDPESDPPRTVLPRIGSAEKALRAPKASTSSSKSLFREVMEEIRDVKRARSGMLDPFIADLRLGRLWQRINESERSLESYERAVQPLTEKHLSKIPPEQTDDVLERQRRRQREALRFLFTRQLRLHQGDEAVALMAQYLDLSLPSERLQTVARLEKILRKQDYFDGLELTTPEQITNAILSSGSLGPLNDLRFRLLEEMLAAAPTDPYLLEAVANMHVRRKDFSTARQLTAELAALPDAQRLSLFSSFAQFRSRDL